MKLFMSVKLDYILDYKAVCRYTICRVRVGTEKFGQIRACSGWAVKIRAHSSGHPTRTYTQIASLLRTFFFGLFRVRSEKVGRAWTRYCDTHSRDSIRDCVWNKIDRIIFIMQSLIVSFLRQPNTQQTNAKSLSIWNFEIRSFFCEIIISLMNIFEINFVRCNLFIYFIGSI